MTLTFRGPQAKQETLTKNWSKVEEDVRKDETTLADFHLRLERLQAQRDDYKTHDETLIRGLKTDVTRKVEVILPRSNMFSLFQTPLSFQREFGSHASFPCLSFQEMQIFKNESKKKSEAAQKVLMWPLRFQHLQCCHFVVILHDF